MVSPVAKVAIAGVGIGSIAVGTGVAGYSYFYKDSFKDKLGTSVLSLTGTTNETQGKARLNELKTVDTNLPTDLNALKTNSTGNDLQKGCLNNSGNSFEKEDSSGFLNFKSFCTGKVGDKTWTNKIDASTGDTHQNGKTAHTRLQNKNESELSEKLVTVKKTTATRDNNADKKAMHGGYTAAYKEMGTDDNAKSFLEVKEYCRT